MEKSKILLTGGHAATTALAVIQEIESRKLGWKIYFAGVKNAIEGKSIKTMESEILTEHGVMFLPLTAGRVQRRFTLWTIPSLLKIPLGLIQSIYYLVKIKPNIVLSFGGFASVPVVIAAKLTGVPVIIHEQTAAAGRANLFAAKFADAIALAREESVRYFNKTKTQIVGNPITREIALAKSNRLAQEKTIFITGGSRGSQKINEAIGLILPSLLSKYKVIHQTGELDFPQFTDFKNNLDKNLSGKYTVFARINPEEIAKIYQKSDLIIARAGANTVSDIIASEKPCILIPLPISYLDEQTKNAKYATKFGNTEIIEQNDLDSNTLLRSIESAFSKLKKRGHVVRQLPNPDLLASGKLVDLIKEHIK